MIQSKWISHIFILCFLLFSNILQAAESYKEAVDFFDKGKYVEAEKIFEALVKENPDNADLFYDLGSVYHRLGKKGEAIAAFLKARSLKPRDPDIKENLNFALRGIQDKLQPELKKGTQDYVMFWEGYFTKLELLYAASFFFTFGFLLWGLSLLKEALSGLSSVAISLVALGVFCTLILTITKDQKWSAITSQSGEVYSGPGEQNSLLFKLHEGAPFAITRSEGKWLQIHLSDGKKGWIAQSHTLVWGS